MTKFEHPTPWAEHTLEVIVEAHRVHAAAESDDPADRLSAWAIGDLAQKIHQLDRESLEINYMTGCVALEQACLLATAMLMHHVPDHTIARKYRDMLTGVKKIDPVYKASMEETFKQ